MTPSKKRIVSELRRSPGKSSVLGFAMLLACWSWSGILFGTEEPDWLNDDHSIQDSANPVGADASTGNSAPQEEPLVYCYEQALDRIRVWSGPLGLHVESVDKYAMSFKDSASETKDGSLGPFSSTESVEMAPELTGTALFPNTKFAFLGGIRVQVGDDFGRYRVEDIRSREVDLLDGSERLTLRMLSATPMGNSPPPSK